MKSIVIYYSYSGNTKAVAGVLVELLSGKGQVDQIELVALAFKRLTIQQGKVKNREFVSSEINKVLRLWPNG